MLDLETAILVAKTAAKKSREPHGVYRRFAGDCTLSERDRDAIYFTRRLCGAPSASSELTHEVWPNGAIKNVKEKK